MSSEVFGRTEVVAERLGDEWPPRVAPPARERTTRPMGTGGEERSAVGRPVAPAASSAPMRPRGRLRRTLSSRRALREAIILREVLGPPKALQRPEE